MTAKRTPLERRHRATIDFETVRLFVELENTPPRQWRSDDFKQRSRELAARGTAAARETTQPPANEVRCSFGATRVGALLARLRLHLATDRFLAELRRDAVWEDSWRLIGTPIEFAARMVDRRFADYSRLPSLGQDDHGCTPVSPEGGR